MSRSQPHIIVGGSAADTRGLDNRAINSAIAYINSRGGGVVELTEGEFIISDAIYLYSNVTLRGQGEKTILKKCNAFRSNLVVNADNQEWTATVENAKGFDVGMGVTIGDNEEASGDRVSIRTITWKSGNKLGFSKPFVDAIPTVTHGGYVQATFPMLYCAKLVNICVQSLILEGNKSNNYPAIESWMNGAIYLQDVKGAMIQDCEAHNFNGLCIFIIRGEDIHIESSQIHHNTKEGIHVGCCIGFVLRYSKIFANAAEMPDRAGLYLCWEARNGIFEENEIFGNIGAGVSIGHRDYNNLFVNNVIRSNSHSGICYRSDTYLTYNNIFKNCLIEDNGNDQEGYGFYIAGDACYTTLEGCTIRDTRPDREKTQRIGIYIGPEVENLLIKACTVEGHSKQQIFVAQPSKKR